MRDPLHAEAYGAARASDGESCGEGGAEPRCVSQGDGRLRDGLDVGWSHHLSVRLHMLAPLLQRVFTPPHHRGQERTHGAFTGRTRKTRGGSHPIQSLFISYTWEFCFFGFQKAYL